MIFLPKEHKYTDTTAANPVIHHKSSDLSRLSGQHYLDVLPPTELKEKPCKKCVICTKKGERRESRYYCENCMSRPTLCVVPCFKLYPTLMDF